MKSKAASRPKANQSDDQQRHIIRFSVAYVFHGAVQAGASAVSWYGWWARYNASNSWFFLNKSFSPFCCASAMAFCAVAIRFIKPSGLRVGGSERADANGFFESARFAGAFGELNGARSIPDIGFFAGSQCPRPIVQVDGQKCLIFFNESLSSDSDAPRRLFPRLKSHHRTARLRRKPRPEC